MAASPPHGALTPPPRRDALRQRVLRQVEATLASTLAAVPGRPPVPPGIESLSLVDDLGLDSVQIVRLLTELEHRLDLALEDIDLDASLSLGPLLDQLVCRVRASIACSDRRQRPASR
ncbi:phosphopantetheine-binding protein [Eleftheria terrae]|uniref:phosphopantetheine-binding protein n=1 Tax=Eleftheria terrae TaxID=1597781 RepID=UPI00263A87FA|nr:phosphopantetheine-binding protein [Eleftheria terrae]WKB54020.1 phosphopantetheine-binding protein [Eleftheria terrae]